jgi:hypothetical protein
MSDKWDSVKSGKGLARNVEKAPHCGSCSLTLRPNSGLVLRSKQILDFREACDEKVALGLALRLAFLGRAKAGARDAHRTTHRMAATWVEDSPLSPISPREFTDGTSP